MSHIGLTHEQLLVLKADIAANAASLPPFAAEIAEVYNQQAVPAFVVWKTEVTAQEWRHAIVGGGGAAQLDALTASKRDALLWATEDVMNPSDPEVRAAIDDWCGSQNTLKAALVAVQKRNATRAEKLLATGTGTTASPATMGWEGNLTYQDVEAAQQAV
jgi:hypothetical protein